MSSKCNRAVVAGNPEVGKESSVLCLICDLKIDQSKVINFEYLIAIYPVNWIESSELWSNSRAPRELLWEDKGSDLN